jgi:hypothetical protein
MPLSYRGLAYFCELVLSDNFTLIAERLGYRFTDESASQKNVAEIACAEAQVSCGLPQRRFLSPFAYDLNDVVCTVSLHQCCYRTLA